MMVNIRWPIVVFMILFFHNVCGAAQQQAPFSLAAASCGETCHTIRDLTAVRVQSNETITAVVALIQPSYALTWIPFETPLINHWCTWAVFDVARGRVALGTPLLLNTSRAWLQVPSCSTCGDDDVHSLQLGGLTGDTTTWVAADGLIRAAWGEAQQPTGVDDDSSTTEWSTTEWSTTEWSTPVGRSSTTADTVETLFMPSLNPIFTAPSLDPTYSTPAFIQDTTQPTLHEHPEANTVPTQQPQQQQQQQQEVVQVATPASPGVAQQGPTRDLGTPGTETNVEFMSRIMRIGVPVLGTVLAIALLATLAYLLCVRYPNNCCTKLCCRNMTSPVQPVQEDTRDRQPRHSILMMYTNRLAASLRVSSRRSSSQTTQQRRSEKDPVIQRELLNKPSLSAHAGGWGSNSLRSRRGSDKEMLVFGETASGGGDGGVLDGPPEVVEQRAETTSTHPPFAHVIPCQTML